MKSKLIIATFGSGSTYLQRSATFWLRELHNNKIVNPHELLNGIGNNGGEYLVKQWMGVNDQSLEQIQAILEKNNTPIVARLCYDHLLLRKESKKEIEKFLKFLNEYFDIYVSRRDNLFDYGLCWAIRKCTDRESEYQINCVHTPEDRSKLYNKKTFNVDPSLIVDQAKKYLNYIDWAATVFPHAYNVQYRDIEINIDQELQKLFPSTLSIADKFGLTISDYSTIGYNLSNGVTYPAQILNTRQSMYRYLESLCEQQILLDTIPIKSTTMHDKLDKVGNIQECLIKFNEWAQTITQSIAPVSLQDLKKIAEQDLVLYENTGFTLLP